MPKLGELVEKVRSKNAGPFWVTVDIFCGRPDLYELVRTSLPTSLVARIYGADEGAIKRFEIADLNVVKLSFPRPSVQGTLKDRDMHGAAWAELIAELSIPDRAELVS